MIRQHSGVRVSRAAGLRPAMKEHPGGSHKRALTFRTACGFVPGAHYRRARAARLRCSSVSECFRHSVLEFPSPLRRHKSAARGPLSPGRYNSKVPSPLWTPSAARVARARMTAFMCGLEATHAVDLADYPALYEFSISRPADFWRAVWTFCDVRGEIGDRIVLDFDKMPGARFFPDARLNFAANLLRRRDDTPALIFNGEGQQRRTMSHRELYSGVTRFAAALRRAGIAPGDRVAGYMPNLPETIVAALGAAAIGAVWSSCSPDFGVEGVLDRFGQIAPRVLVAPTPTSTAARFTGTSARQGRPRAHCRPWSGR